MADAGILFPPIPAGIPFPADPAGILFPADLAEPVTVGVADLANAGILFPAVPAGIPFPTDTAGILFLADLAEPVTVGVADLGAAGAAPRTVPDVFTELKLFTMEMAEVVGTVDGIPIYYGGDYDVCGIRNVMTLDILAILMVSPNHLTMRTPGMFITMSGWSGVILTRRILWVFTGGRGGPVACL